jgi:hypothetical protein
MGFLLMKKGKARGFIRILRGPSPYNLKAHPQQRVGIDMAHETLDLNHGIPSPAARWGTYDE